MELLDKQNPAAVAEYEDYLIRQRNGSYLQSTHWAKAKPDWAWDVLLLRDKDGKLTASALVMRKRLPMHLSLLYSPRGPVCDYHDEAVLRRLLEEIRIYAKRERCILFRVDPAVSETDQKAIALFHSVGLRAYETGSMNGTAQPRNNYILPLSGKSEEEILMAFHQKWRYNIRLAERKGVVCQICPPDKIDDFYDLLCATAKRDGFAPRPKMFYETVLREFGENARLYLCTLNGEPLSGAVCLRYGYRTTYAFGASSNEHRETMPNHLMQWEMIRWAIAGSCQLYDFGGVFNTTDPSQPSYSLYRFKKGFNGQLIRYPGDLDLNLRPVARLFHVAEKIRHKLVFSRMRPAEEKKD